MFKPFCQKCQKETEEVKPAFPIVKDQAAIGILCHGEVEVIYIMPWIEFADAIKILEAHVPTAFPCKDHHYTSIEYMARHNSLNLRCEEFQGKLRTVKRLLGE